MADDRPANNDLAAVVAELRREVADLKGTALARASRMPTGSIEATILPTPKPDTLVLNGETKNRVDYPGLWQWIVDNGLTPSVFGAGNGSTTFVLPDYRGRTMTGATAARPVGTLSGAATTTLTVANLPPHNHSGSTGADSPSHTHSGTTSGDSPSHQHYSGGNHGGHRPNVVDGGAGNNARWPTDFNGFSGDVGWSGNASNSHSHGFGTGNASNGHGHSFTTGNTGSGSPVNIEGPSFSGNWIIWT